jgi:nitrogen-specific signal transduction histidine kinase
VYGIVKNHGGWISVDSQLGKGTVVRIYFPVVQVPAEQAEKPHAEPEKGTDASLIN